LATGEQHDNKNNQGAAVGNFVYLAEKPGRKNFLTISPVSKARL